jgi:hypothetical protein
MNTNLFPQFMSPQGANSGLSQLKYSTNSSYGKRTSLGLRLLLFWPRSEISAILDAELSPNGEALNLKPFFADGVNVVIP